VSHSQSPSRQNVVQGTLRDRDHHVSELNDLLLQSAVQNLKIVTLKVTDRIPSRIRHDHIDGNQIGAGSKDRCGLPSLPVLHRQRGRCQRSTETSDKPRMKSHGLMSGQRFPGQSPVTRLVTVPWTAKGSPRFGGVGAEGELGRPEQVARTSAEMSTSRGRPAQDLGPMQQNPSTIKDAAAASWCLTHCSPGPGHRARLSRRTCQTAIHVGQAIRSSDPARSAKPLYVI